VVTTVDIKGEVAEFASMFGENKPTKVELRYGNFTNSDKRGLIVTGKEEYNIEYNAADGKNDFTTHGVVSEDGKKLTMMNGHILELMDEEAIKKMEERDPADNPPNTYEPQPENVGKIIWISGLSGMGKTTTAKLLQEKEGFVNYEGDCFIMGLNPYVGASEKGSSYFGTRPLKGISEERKVICKLAMEEGYKQILKGITVDPKIWEDFYNLLCDDILRERTKLGGQWVVCQAVYTKAGRDVIRNMLGDDLAFVVLESGEDDIQVERMVKRSLGDGEITKEVKEETRKKYAVYAGGHEPVEDDELNTFSIYVTKDMTPDDVAKAALEFVKQK